LSRRICRGEAAAFRLAAREAERLTAMLRSTRRTNDEVQEEIDMHDLVRKKVALDDERRKMAHATLRLEQERRQLEVSGEFYCLSRF
jgi:hypothetical protein